MKNFPNYLLQNKENVPSKRNLSHEQVWQPQVKRKTFHPSSVPSILHGITKDNRMDYSVIKEALRLNESDFLLFTNDNQIDHVFSGPIVQTKQPQNIKHTGLHRTLEELVAENEHMHFILTKGDSHER